MDAYSMREAADKWGVPYRSLQSRLRYDMKDELDMLGSRKSGKNWIITDSYMTDRYGKPKTEGSSQTS